MSFCNLCPRNCNVDRQKNIGFCCSNDKIKIAKADLHFWEEPCISAQNGSGTIFFSGCSLGCCFCQNAILSHDNFGVEVSEKRFYEILFELKEKGANNINLVTADHFLKQVIPVIFKAKKDGFDLPIILNTSSYLKIDVVNQLKGVVDVYIADFKFFSSALSEKYANAPDYPEIAKLAIDAMFSQVGKTQYVNGNLVKGVIVRILVLPGNVLDAKMTIKYILDKYGSDVCISIMNQYTPVIKSGFPELLRILTDSEYKSVVDYAISHGIVNGYIQEKGSETTKYIPDFDLKGV